MQDLVKVSSEWGVRLDAVPEILRFFFFSLCLSGVEGLGCGRAMLANFTRCFELAGTLEDKYAGDF